MPNIVYDQFHKKPLWVANKCVELYGIRLYDENISLKIHWYEQILVISGSDMFYRFYCDSPPQVQSHTELVHGKISMTEISGTA